MLIQRADVRLAVVSGLGNGLAVLSGLPFGYYVPLAVLAMGTGSYGGALGLGRQRILGSALGSLLVVVGSRGLAGVPMPLALALTLAALRLIGGALGLQVGYKVGGVIVVMGWLVHGAQLDQWIGLRLGWTSFGVILTLLSLRLFWPSHALPQALADRAALLGDIGSLFRDLADQREGLPSPAMERTRALQIRHTQLRRQVPSLAEEFGSLALRHPAARLIEALD
ncbi:MAG: FUSC family protein, partial [Cyanobium sp.]